MNDVEFKWMMEDADPASGISDAGLYAMFPNVNGDAYLRPAGTRNATRRGALTRPRLIAALVLLASLGGAFFTGAELASASPATPRSHAAPSCDSTDGAPNFPTVSAAGQLDSSLESKYPDVFGGLELSNCNATIVVFETSLSAQLAASASAVAPPGSLKFEVVQNTMKQLMSVQSEVGADVNALASQGIEVTSYGIDIPSDLVEIEVSNPTSSKIAALQQRFGAGLVEVDPSTPGSQL